MAHINNLPINGRFPARKGRLRKLLSESNNNVANQNRKMGSTPFLRKTFGDSSPRIASLWISNSFSCDHNNSQYLNFQRSNFGENKSGVCRINCDNCYSSYIGQTGRNLKLDYVSIRKSSKMIRTLHLNLRWHFTVFGRATAALI